MLMKDSSDFINEISTRHIKFKKNLNNSLVIKKFWEIQYTKLHKNFGRSSILSYFSLVIDFLIQKKKKIPIH